MNRLINDLVFLARTGFPLGCLYELREWCSVMYHYNVFFDLDDPELERLCREVVS